MRKYVWPSPYAQSLREERIRLACESRDAVRHQWRGGRTVRPPTADPRNPAEWGVWATRPE
eukprot:3345013-Alexandrium_andersonii.AAC.1